MNAVESKPFLRIPPFPGARAVSFDVRATAARSEIEAAQFVADIRRAKVGGDYWGKQPPLPDLPYTLIKLADPAQALDEAAKHEAVVLWDHASSSADPNVTAVAGCCDPWHLLGRAASVVVDADEELALIAAIAGVSLKLVGQGRFAVLSDGPESVEAAVEDFVLSHSYVDPFTDAPIGALDALRHCAFWRELIEANRDITAAFGFAFWKRPTVAPLLWAGDEPVRFETSLHQARTDGAVAIWKSRTPDDVLEELQQRGATTVEVEDGFIRSTGLGADCVPPLSIVVDRVGVHFDPSAPSELEEILQNDDFPPDAVRRAGELRRLIVESGVSKYGAGLAPLDRRDASRLHILVPGQVEDDRAVLSGGGPVITNLELLKRARQSAPDAYIIYKPHPDVEAGHRVGSIPDADCLAVADEIVRDQPISALIDLVDELHVNSSLAGFEALLRQKLVTTHGVPFYAGWGLTNDLGSVPARRTAKRSLDELVAAVLLVYPRYLDPVSGLPCPPEILVRRIAEGASEHQGGKVVQLRRLQGRLKKRLAGLGAR